MAPTHRNNRCMVLVTVYFRFIINTRLSSIWKSSFANCLLCDTQWRKPNIFKLCENSLRCGSAPTSCDTRVKWRKLYVHRFEKDIIKEIFIEILSKFGEAESCKIMCNENENSNEFDFVCFNNTDSSAMCIMESLKLRHDGNMICVVKAVQCNERIKAVQHQYNAACLA